MKKLLLFFALILKSSFTFAMQPDPAEYIRRQIIQFQAEGTSPEEIAQVSTNALREMLEYPLIRTLPSINT